RCVKEPGFKPPPVLGDSNPNPKKLKLRRDTADNFPARRFNGARDTGPKKTDDAFCLKVPNARHGCLKTACPN
ncbi:hypothetical protein, partial [Neisseria meningitidis]|uniref:hypothetical protein n=1 Tax=Neisseria meningitidis TaxID=487 RepID=UPI001C57C272